MLQINSPEELLDIPVGQIVAEDYRAAFLLKDAGIDFCCGGDKSLRKAIRNKDVSQETLLQDLYLLDQNDRKEQNYNDWPIEFLVQYIINVHHAFVRKTLPNLQFYADKVARVHGDTHPELIDIKEKVEQIVDEFMTHLAKEESDQFPSILSAQKGEPIEKEAFAKMLQDLREDHVLVGQLMAQIRRLSDDFTPPQGACNSYCILFKTLKDFEEDLHLHVHLENNILFPKATALV